jgi:hypothetical protein
LRRFLETLENIRSEEKSFGVKVKIKKSPLGKGEGYLDPYEKTILEKEPAWQEQGELPPPEILLPIIRDGMGFPNLNLNTQEMITKYEELNLEGNLVEVWRYYKRKGKQKDRPCLV